MIRWFSRRDSAVSVAAVGKALGKETRKGTTVPPTLLRALRRIVGAENLITRPSELIVYECDGYTLEKETPPAVVFPKSTEATAAVVRACREHGVPVLPRGAGTGLAGGATPLHGCVVVSLARMKRILEISPRDRMVHVQAGVLNLELGSVLAGTYWHFAPDPSSQAACTIGGNIATNAGGPHTLKYGVTVNHILGMTWVTGEGEVLEIGPETNSAEFDWIGLLTGSEGTLGIATEAWLRLTPLPIAHRTFRATFDRVEDAGNAVSRIIAAGVIPAAMELLDRGILQALEEAFHFGFPADAEAILVVELDGMPIALDEQEGIVLQLCRDCHAKEILSASSEAERELLWHCRKSAVAAVGRLSPGYFIQDGVVPRSRLPELVRRVASIGRERGVRIVNVAHAGDGNIHPILLFDERKPDEVRRAMEAGRAILQACIELGGSITAEHGVGIEKLPLMTALFSRRDLDAMRRIQRVFDPGRVMTPGKVLPPAESEAFQAAGRD
ncbi:MAG: FAD-binding protein [Thermogutta sp.]|nr:FAD-binding protein [Thermogutta sp.]